MNMSIENIMLRIPVPLLSFTVRMGKFFNTTQRLGGFAPQAISAAYYLVIHSVVFIICISKTSSTVG